MCFQALLPALIGGGAAVAGARAQGRAASAAANATTQATGMQLDYLREGRDLSLQMSQPYRDVSTAAQAAMMDMMGLPRPMTPSTSATGMPATGAGTPSSPVGSTGLFGGLFDRLIETRDATAGQNRNTLPPGVSVPSLGDYQQYDWQTSPSYGWRFDEGMRALGASSSASGGLLSGGAMREAIEYGQGMGSQEYANIYNRLGVLAGFGSVGLGSASNAIQTASGYGSQAIGEAGASRASAYVAQGNASAGLWGDLGSIAANLPWNEWFPGGGGGGTGANSGWGG